MNKRESRVWFLFAGLFVCLAVSFGLRWQAATHDRPFNRVEPGLYIGRAVATPPQDTTAVVNLCGRPDGYVVQTNLWEPMFQPGQNPTLETLQRVVDFIADQRRAGRTTYVHCLAGQNRSGAAVTAFLMHEHGWSRDEALAFLQKRRPQVQPNPFMMQLLDEWETKLKAEPEN